MSDLRYSPLNRKVVALLFSLLLLVASIIILIPEYIRSELELLLLLLLPGGPVWVDLVVQSQRNFVVLFYRSQWLEGRFQWIRAKRGRHRRQMTIRRGLVQRWCIRMDGIRSESWPRVLSSQRKQCYTDELPWTHPSHCHFVYNAIYELNIRILAFFPLTLVVPWLDIVSSTVWC